MPESQYAVQLTWPDGQTETGPAQSRHQAECSFRAALHQFEAGRSTAKPQMVSRLCTDWEPVDAGVNAY